MATNLKESKVHAAIRRLNQTTGSLQRIRDLKMLLETEVIDTWEPLLPLALNLQGSPYTLENHEPFSPMYRTRPSRELVLKTGRQCAKSTNLAALTVIASYAIPYFKTLHLTPLFEQIRRFSSNVVRPFIDTSPLAKLWRDNTIANSVLQRSFNNQSMMVFSFCGLDASRVRGLSSDRLCIDESVCEFTLVHTPTGDVMIKDLKPGDIVMGYAGKNTTWTTVYKHWYAGERHCFRVTLEDGSYVDSTADSFLTTDTGHIRLDELIHSVATGLGLVSEEPVTPEKPTDPSNTTGTETDGLRDHVGRWLSDTQRKLCHDTRMTAERLSLDKVHDLVRLRTWKTVQAREQQIRNWVCQFPQLQNFGIRVPKVDMVSARQKSCRVETARRYRRFRMATNCDVVGARRWFAVRDGRVSNTATSNMRFSNPGGRTLARMADGSRPLLLSGDEKGPLKRRHNCNTSDNTFNGRIGGGFNASSVSGGAGFSEIQSRGYWDRKIGNLSVLSETVPAAFRSTTIQQRKPKIRNAPRKGLQTIQEKRRVPTRQTVIEKPTVTAKLITKIEYIGVKRVYDVEVGGNQSLVTNGHFRVNCQDFDPAHYSVVQQCLSASKYKLTQYTGTPKSRDNPLEGLWQQSSQAEWVIKCHNAGCGAWNIPTIEHHLMDMLGPWRPDISEAKPAVVCHKCRKPIFPRTGNWIHKHRDKRAVRAGYHVPQIILPQHFASPDDWGIIIAKQNGAGNTTFSRFCNEILGESVDVGQKLVSETDLRKAATLPWLNRIGFPDQTMLNSLRDYEMKVLAVDWGGGGESETSFTVFALLGYRAGGYIDVLWGKRLTSSQEHIREANELRYWADRFNADYIAHDYTGAGTVRETVLRASGVPDAKIIPIAYTGAMSGHLIKHVPASATHNRDYYRLNKAKSLLYVCSAIKLGFMRFFEYDGTGEVNVGLLQDFLSLTENKTETRIGDIYSVIRNPILTDDFAQAVNIGAAAIWHANNSWPDFSTATSIADIHEELLKLAGHQNYGWEDLPEMEIELMN